MSEGFTIPKYFFNQNLKMIQRLQKRLIIPSTEFNKDEYSAIRSVLGNDVFIKSYTKNDIILPNGQLIVDVEFEQIDFNSFKIYKVSNAKQLNVNSDKYIVEFKRDNISDETPVYVKLIKPKLNNDSDSFYIRLYSCKQEVPYESEKKNQLYEPLAIHYYGLQVLDHSDIQHDFCSIFGNSKLSYHGTQLETKLDNNFKNVINKIPNEIIKVDPKKEMKAFTELNTITKDYVNNYYNISCFKKSDLINEMKVIVPKDENDYKEILKYKNCIIDFRELNRYSLGKLLSNLHFGFVILTNIRSPTTMIYFNDKDYLLEDKMINYTVLTVCLDLENVIEFYSK